MKRSREIVEIFADVVARTSANCTIVVSDNNDEYISVDCPTINYIFGNARYVKDYLDELSKDPTSANLKYPLIALFCPFVEKRNTPDFYSQAKVRVLIACASTNQFSNEQRRQISFENILRPIYRNFLEALKEDGRFDFGYNEHVQHDYSENYSYGRYGAVTDTGEEVTDSIDAINITNLILNVNPANCRE